MVQPSLHDVRVISNRCQAGRPPGITISRTAYGASSVPGTYIRYSDTASGYNVLTVV